MIKILILDLETAPLKSFHWKMFKENISLDQLISESYVLSWCAKWHHSSAVMYMDNRSQKNFENDKAIIKRLCELVDEADMVVAHNGRAFDMKVLGFRIATHKLDVPSAYHMIDTLTLARKYIRCASYKLAHLAEHFNVKYKKLDHGQYPGFKLWREIVDKRNLKAWQCMEKYNKYDVLSLEELYFETFYKFDIQTHKKMLQLGKKLNIIK